MAAELAFVRCDVPDNLLQFRSRFDNGDDGFLVPPEDAQALSDAILNLIEDDVLRNTFKEKAREKAKNNFSIVDSIDKTIEVYKKIAK